MISGRFFWDLGWRWLPNDGRLTREREIFTSRPFLSLAAAGFLFLEGFDLARLLRATAGERAR